MAHTKQEHLLICLMEEAAEVAQAASKLLRFGNEPATSEHPQSTVDRLVLELNDIAAVLELLSAEKVLPPYLISHSYVREKKEKLQRMVLYSQKRGLLFEE